MCKQAIQNSLLWWSNRKWLYYISLGALTYLATLIVMGKAKWGILYLILFVVAIYFCSIAYAFTLLFHRIGLLSPSASTEDRDAMTDGQLVLNIAAIMLPINYILFSFISSHLNEGLTSGYITLFINAVICAMVFQPISQLLNKEYEPETKKMLGIIIFVLFTVGLFVLVAFPSLDEALSRLRIKINSF